jgi:hypothetical protein
MDPYLEGEMRQEFHERFANQISEQLLPQLKPKYVALLAKRYAIEIPALGIEKTIYPDVHIVKEARAAYAPAPVRAPLGDDAPRPIELDNPPPEPAPYLAVEIRDVASRRLVTVIEILSPANKQGDGAREYNAKRALILMSNTHPSVESTLSEGEGLRTSLLEIDLLRHGERIRLVGELPPASYYVFLSRTTRRPKTQVYPIQLRDKPPTVPVPLLPPDPDVALDLQAALDACFELVGYERLLDYSQPLADLSAEDAAWVEEVLRATCQTGETLSEMHAVQRG